MMVRLFKIKLSRQEKIVSLLPMMHIIGAPIQAMQEMMLEDSIVTELSYLFDKLRQINLYL